MASELEADWQLFRRYKFEGMRIKDTKDRIHFSQRVSMFHQRANGPIITVRVLGGLIWIVPTILIAMQGGAVAAVVYFCLATIPIGIVIWIAYAIFRDRMSLDVYPGRVVIREGSKETTINYDDIQNIDVRAMGQQNYGIYVWYKKIPILTFTQKSEQNGISLREGIALAIALMNETEVVVAAAPARATRKRSFEE